METETSGAAEAIQEIERLAKEADGLKTVDLDVPDGAGEVRTVEAIWDGSRLVVPASAMVEAAELARKLRTYGPKAPGWRAGTAAHQSLVSFIEHIDRFKKADTSVVWADAARRRLVSILDYHQTGADSPASWGRHRGTYECPLSPSWIAWGGEKGLVLSQEAFADLLDTRDYELAGNEAAKKGATFPAPAALITLANNLEVYSTATAKRERDPNTGRIKVSYSEDKGVNGTVTPPPAFLILIRVLEDAEPRVLEVRLRVTVDDGRARFTLLIHRASEILREVFAEVADDVVSETGLPVFVGTPEQYP